MAPRHAAPTDPTSRVRAAPGRVAVVLGRRRGRGDLRAPRRHDPRAVRRCRDARSAAGRAIIPTGRGVSADAPLRVRLQQPARRRPRRCRRSTPAVAGTWVRLSATRCSLPRRCAVGAGHDVPTCSVPSARRRRRDGTTLHAAVVRAASPSRSARCCGSTRSSPSSATCRCASCRPARSTRTSTAVQRGTFDVALGDGADRAHRRCGSPTRSP